MNTNPIIKFSVKQQEKIKAYSELLDETKSQERILKAEIYRELGAFEKCIKLLNYGFEDKYERNAADFIESPSENRIRIVCEYSNKF